MMKRVVTCKPRRQYKKVREFRRLLRNHDSLDIFTDNDLKKVPSRHLRPSLPFRLIPDSTPSKTCR